MIPFARNLLLAAALYWLPFAHALDRVTIARNVADPPLNVQDEQGGVGGLRLSGEERAWLDAHPLIRLGVDPAGAPFEFIDGEGRHGGPAADYVVLLGKHLGVRFEYGLNPRTLFRWLAGVGAAVLLVLGWMLWWNRRLKREVDRRKRVEEALRQARAEAERANLSKSRFLANMSHEIRTPMNAIVGMCHLACQTDLDPRQRDYLHNIQVASNTLLGVINDILDLSRIEAGKLELESVRFSLDEVIDHLIGIHGLKAEQKGLELFVSIDPDTPRELVGDPRRLGQVLANLVNNALKFTEHGEIVVRVGLARKSLRHAELHFSVSDSGIGIAAEVLPTLFNPFEQADGSTTRRFGGTGLGLSISRRLVERMGGEIGASSEPGVGTTFRFNVRLGLPAEGADGGAVVAAALAPVARRAAARLDFDGARVLLVEDNAINRLVARELLESVNLRVVEAANGIEALKAVAAQPLDLVLMDIQMPEMDGLDATRRIRADGRLAALPIIAMTAHALSGDRERCLEAGMNDHVGKPIDPPTLFATIGRWLTPAAHQAAAAPAEETARPAPVPMSSDAGGENPRLDREWGLKRVAGNEALLDQLWRDFVAEHGGDGVPLREAVAAGELERVARISHALAGVSGTIGARRLYPLARAVELAAEQGNSPLAGERVAALGEELAALVGEIDARSESPSPPPPVAGRALPEDVERLVAAVVKMLEECDPRVQEYATALESGWLDDPEEIFKGVAKQIREYNFDQALEMLRRYGGRLPPPRERGEGRGPQGDQADEDTLQDHGGGR